MVNWTCASKATGGTGEESTMHCFIPMKKGGGAPRTLEEIIKKDLMVISIPEKF